MWWNGKLVQNVPEMYAGLVTDVRASQSKYSDEMELSITLQLDRWPAGWEPDESLIIPVRGKVLKDEVAAIQPLVGERATFTFKGRRLMKGIEPGSLEASEPRSSYQLWSVEVAGRERPSAYAQVGMAPVAGPPAPRYDDEGPQPDEQPDLGPAPY